MGITEILCSFRLVLEGKTGKQISESSRLEFSEKFSANNLALSNAEDNTSGSLNRRGIALTYLTKINRYPYFKSLIELSRNDLWVFFTKIIAILILNVVHLRWETKEIFHSRSPKMTLINSISFTSLFYWWKTSDLHLIQFVYIRNVLKNWVNKKK